MNDIEVSSIDLVEGGNVFKQGHYLTLGYIPRDEKGETVDLSGKTLNVALWGRKGVVFEAVATYSAGVIRFTFDKLVAAGDYTVEFTATSSTDSKYRKKFPTNQHSGRIAIKQSADDLGVVGIQVYTVAQLKAEQKALLDAAVSGFTVDSETKMARVSGTTTHPTIGARLEADKQATALQLAEKAAKTEVRKDTAAQPINVSEMDTETKQLFTGGSVAVVGKDAVGKENIKSKAVSVSKLDFTVPTKNIFDGQYFAYAMNYNATTGKVQYRDPVAGETLKTAVIPIESSKTYTLKIHQPTLKNRFTLGVLNSLPTTGTTFKPVDLTVYSGTDVTLNEITFTNSAEGRFLLVYVSNAGLEPAMQVELGGTATPYTPPFALDTGKVSTPVEWNDLRFLRESTTNLFTGVYQSGALQIVNDIPYYRRGLEGEKLAVIKVAPNQTYTVKSHEPEKTNRFIIVGMTNEPTFNSGGWTVVEAGFVDDAESPEFTLTTPENVNYLLVYVSSEGKTPLLQVEAGNQATPYLPKKYIPKEYLELPSFQNVVDSTPSKTEQTYNIFDEVPNVYERPANLTGVSSSDAVKIQDTSFAEIYSLYDDLVSRFPIHFTKKLLGYGTGVGGAEDRTLPIYEYTYKPAKPDAEGVRYPRLLMTSAVHGNEKLSVWTIYQIMKDICENQESSEFASFFAHNVEIRLIPIVNPGGYNLNTRNNANNVNLNRNGESNWSGTQEFPGAHPLSELESQMLDRWYAQYKDDTIAYIDSHNINGIHETTQGRYGFVWIISPDKAMRNLAMHTLSTLSRKWLKEIVSFQSFSENTMLGDTSDYNGGMMMEHAYDKYGIRSVVPDPERTAVQYYPNMVVNGLELLKVNMDTVGSLMIGIMKNFAK